MTVFFAQAAPLEQIRAESRRRELVPELRVPTAEAGRGALALAAALLRSCDAMRRFAHLPHSSAVVALDADMAVLCTAANVFLRTYPALAGAHAAEDALRAALAVSFKLWRPAQEIAPVAALARASFDDTAEAPPTAPRIAPGIALPAGFSRNGAGPADEDAWLLAADEDLGALEGDAFPDNLEAACERVRRAEEAAMNAIGFDAARPTAYDFLAQLCLASHMDAETAAVARDVLLAFLQACPEAVVSFEESLLADGAALAALQLRARPLTYAVRLSHSQTRARAAAALALRVTGMAAGAGAALGAPLAPCGGDACFRITVEGAAALGAAQSPLAASTFVRSLGAGAYGQVDLRDTRGGLVAVKTLHASPKEFGQFGLPYEGVREVALMQLITPHANVVGVRGGEADGAVVRLLLEPAAGGTLRDYMARERPAPDAPGGLAAIRAILGDVLAGLAHIHSLGVLHLDLKPENVLVGAGGRFQVADFGLSAAWDAFGRARYDPAQVQTADYRAPECFAAQAVDELYARGGRSMTQLSFAADAWSVGCIAWQLAARRYESPFRVGHVADERALARAIRDALGDAAAADFDSLPPAAAAAARDLFARPVGARRPRAPPAGADGDLLEVTFGLLAYDPRLRTSAAQALAQPFFAPLRERAAAAAPHDAAERAKRGHARRVAEAARPASRRRLQVA